MERRHQGLRLHRAERFRPLRHFVFAFHDSTFECAARQYSVELREEPLSVLLPEMQTRLMR